jgi:hypothetical protein
VLADQFHSPQKHSSHSFSGFNTEVQTSPNDLKLRNPFLVRFLGFAVIAYQFPVPTFYRACPMRRNLLISG